MNNETTNTDNEITSMENEIGRADPNLLKYWYLPLISGLIFIGMGIYTIVHPLASYVALSVMFSMSFLIAGMSEIIFSISNRNEMENWGWTLTFGLFTFTTGVLLMIHPEITLTTLPLFIGFLVLFRSIGSVGFSLELKSFKEVNWGYLLALGILGIFFSIFLIQNPTIVGMTVVVWTGTAMITAGFFSIYLSFKLKDWNSISKEV